MKCPDTPRRRASIITFGVAYFAVAGLIGPTLVVLFNVGVAEPRSQGWPFASVLFCVAGVVTAVITAAFALGTYIPNRSGRYRSERLRTLAILSAGVALAAPFVIVACLSVLGALIPGLLLLPGPMQFPVALLAMIGIGTGLGYLTMKHS